MKSKILNRIVAIVLAAMISLTTMPAMAAEPYDTGNISVGEAIEALYALEGEPSMIKQIYNEEDETFATYEKNAKSWAYAYDIMSEDTNTNDSITQSELAELLYRFAKHHDVDVTANGQQDADDWAAGYGFIPANPGNRNEEVTPGELSAILSNYEAAELPKVGVVSDGLTLIFPSEKETTINPLCDFYVVGDIDPSVTVPNDALLSVQLKDSNGVLMRDVFTNIKDNQQGMYVDYPGIEISSGSRESFRGSMMPDLVYDPNFPETFRNTWMKAYYTDEHYTSIIYGGAYHDDINPVDQYGRTLEPLPEGDYNLTVSLYSNTGAKLLASLSTQITVETVPKKIISRFSPVFYFDRVKEYAASKGYRIYIDPFVGAWNLSYFIPQWKQNYIGFINKRWRLIDRMCYTGGMTYYFDYNTTATSTSYTVELGQIGYLKNLEDPNRLTYIYWDIGEPEIKQLGKVYTGQFVEKSVSEMEPVTFTRVDRSANETPENTIDPAILNKTTSIFDLTEQFNAAPGEVISLNGFCKVIQPENVTLNENGTVTFGNRIVAIRYTLASPTGKVYQVVEKDVGLKRTFEDGSTTPCILEFRHNFDVDKSMRGKDIEITAQAIDEFGNDVGEPVYACQYHILYVPGR